jgi:hypothetical protein
MLRRDRPIATGNDSLGINHWHAEIKYFSLETMAFDPNLFNCCIAQETLDFVFFHRRIGFVALHNSCSA